MDAEEILPEFEGGREVHFHIFVSMLQLTRWYAQFIQIWRLECVGYDEQFQRRLAREYPVYLASHRRQDSDDDSN